MVQCDCFEIETQDYRGSIPPFRDLDLFIKHSFLNCSALTQIIDSSPEVCVGLPNAFEVRAGVRPGIVFGETVHVRSANI